MKILTIFSDGSEDSELIITVDLLRRASIDVEMMSISGETVILSHGIKVEAESLLFDFNDDMVDEYDGLFIPGGKAGVENLLENERVMEIIRLFNDRNKLISAICAAPTVLSKSGALDNKRFTCYDGWERIASSGDYVKENVVTDKNAITGRSLNYSVEFSLAIIEYLLGKEESLKVSKGILRI